MSGRVLIPGLDHSLFSDGEWHPEMSYARVAENEVSKRRKPSKPKLKRRPVKGERDQAQR